MFQISFPVSYSKIDEIIEKIEAIGEYSTYYEAPFEVTTDSNGYGYYEKENEVIILKVFPEAYSKEEALIHLSRLRELLKLNDEIKLDELKDNDWQEPFEPVDLGNGWVIAEPYTEVDSENRINFESQGSFGTGLHETTQDLLRFILDYDFSGLTVLDLGTGSGILSIAAGIKNAERIVALDMRDVTDEVMYNASLNELNNVQVVVEDVTAKDYKIDEKFDVVFINIGGEETLASMRLINSVLKEDGLLFVSGLVEWSSEQIRDEILKMQYQIKDEAKTNEWVTFVLKKIKESV